MKYFVSSCVLAGILLLLSRQSMGGQTLPAVSSGNLRLWLSSDTGVITNSNGAVEQWQDQGPESNSAYQSDTNKQPILVANVFNGKPAIQFDGIQTYAAGDLLLGSGDLRLTDAYTCFVVFSRTGPTGSDQAVAYVGTPGVNNTARGSYLKNGDQMAFSGWANDYFTSFHVSTNRCHIQTQRMNVGKTIVDMFDVNGNATNTFTTSIGVSGLLDPTAGYAIGGLDAWMLNLKGSIAEVIYYEGALTDADQVAVEDYLYAKYMASTPVILSQPLDQFVIPGGTARFSADVNGARTLTYEWLFNNAELDGALGSSLVISNVQPSDAGSYQLLAFNSYGTATSAIVNLAILNPVSITEQPQDQSTAAGSNVTFSAFASGDWPRYQWRFNGVNLSGETNTTLFLSNVQTTQAGFYSVAVSNEVNSVVSTQARLSVITPPVVSSQPQDFYGLSGSLVALSVGTVGAVSNTTLPAVSSGTLQLWLKADSGVVTNGNGRVSQWSDQSGKTNDCTQAGTNQQPTIVTNAMNGRPVIRFDGVQDSSNGDYLQSTRNLTITNAFTSFVAYSLAPRVVTEQMLVAVGTPGSANRLRSHYVRTSGITNEMALAAWSNDYGSGYSIPTTSTRIWSIRLSTNLSFLEFFDRDSITSTFASRTSTNLLAPSSGYYVGGLGFSTRNFKGDIAEVLVYRGALTESERLQVESYLSTRYLVASQNVSYQWKINGTNIVGATNASLTLTNTQSADSGVYSVTVSNAAGSTTSDGATVRIRNILPYINGQLASKAMYEFTNVVSVSFVSAFTNALIFYTLDGSAPSFNSQSYNGPFSVSQSALVRAVAYSSDFSQIEEADAVAINILPLYTLTSVSPGGGTILAAPSQGSYASNTFVTLTPVASNGWTFLGWSGDLSGSNPTNSFTITNNTVVQAIFGTTVLTTTAGNGMAQRYPALPFYPYGSTLKVTAIPQAGSYFGIWGNAATGNTNPLSFKVTNANQTISSLFSTLGANQAALTILTKGLGQVVVNPRSNLYTTGQSVMLTPTPDAGQVFIGWSGDVAGVQNPLSVTMDQSKFITAVFSKGIQFTNSQIASNAFEVTLSSPIGVYNLQTSSNLADWLPVVTLTNNIGQRIRFVLSTNLSRSFYRLVEP